MLTLKIERVKSKSGKRTLFVPTINGERINSTNYARKYDARNALKVVTDHYTEQELLELIENM